MTDLINCLSDTIDLVSPVLADHHKRVAIVAQALAAEAGLPPECQADLYFAGSLHDIGALSLNDRIKLLEFEGLHPEHHCETGALLLEMFPPLAPLASMIRHHHIRWDAGDGADHRDAAPLGSHILHLADRISVLIGTMDGIGILTRVPDIVAKVEAVSGSMFSPRLVEAFKDLSCKDSFWLGIAYPARNPLVQNEHLKKFKLDTHGILELSRLFARIIDFRSRFTATHSSGVAACAESLARLSGLSDEECTMMRIAGLLHDLGKLAVPAELLEKPAPLDERERSLIHCHTYFTRRALENIAPFRKITAWGADHHERLDGKGYPYRTHDGEISQGARIMAVADVFTAITEDRPYRPGMDQHSARNVLNGMAIDRALDGDVVHVLNCNFADINDVRASAQSDAVREYTVLGNKVALATCGTS